MYKNNAILLSNMKDILMVLYFVCNLSYVIFFIFIALLFCKYQNIYVFDILNINLCSI